MPLYEYRCTSCGYSFEKIQNFSATPETECPKCRGVLIRPVTAPALRFEGAGWYVNDYAGKGGSKNVESTAGDGPKPTADAKEAKPTASDSASATSAAPAPAASSTPSTASPGTSSST